MSKALAAEVFQVGIGGPILAGGSANPSAGAGYPAAKASQYLRSDGTRWTKVGDADTDWLPPSAFIKPNNGDVVTLNAGMPVVLSGSIVKRANANSVALSTVIGVVFHDAATTLPTTVVTGGTCEISTAQWDAVTGQSGGLTPGATYWLGTALGTLSTAPPAVAGQSVCVVGRALSATDLQVGIQAPILL